jgi:hypothetical protein
VVANIAFFIGNTGNFYERSGFIFLILRPAVRLYAAMHNILDITEFTHILASMVHCTIAVATQIVTLTIRRETCTTPMRS